MGGEQSDTRPSVCVSVLRSSPGSLLLRSFQSGGPGTRNKARAEGRAGGEEDRDRGPSPYIISSPERVAIISRQWPTDRSASQKGPGHIIAATHRPRRSGQSWGSAPSRLLFSPRTDEFLLTATGPATSITRRVSCRARWETRTTETGYSGGMRVSSVPRRESRIYNFCGLREQKNQILFLSRIFQRYITISCIFHC